MVKNPDLLPIKHDHIKRISSFCFTVLCENKELRQFYISQFSGAGVELRPVIAGNIQSQPFYKKYIDDSYKLPGVEFIDDCGFYFGNYPELNNQDLQTLKSCLTNIS
jgi:CDP-6-deoxy-D-xylo-4-hexulose-3-dehydrase